MEENPSSETRKVYDQQKQSIVDENGHTDEAEHAKMDENGPETTPNNDEKDSPPQASPSKATTTVDHKRKRLDDNDPDSDDADEFAKQYSRAQVTVKVKRARLEANIAVQDDIKTLRLALLKAEQHAQDKARERDQAEQRYETLQQSMQEIVKLHQRTLLGMRDNLKLENLVASLDKEKASKESLKLAFQQQNAELLRAQQRMEALNAQITKYQKTETVLAQSISHFQHQFASKDHEKAASIERVKQSLEMQHQDTRVALEEQVERLTALHHALQVQLQELQVEHAALQKSAASVLDSQEKRIEEESHLRGRVAQLETEKAVLQSKVEQVQKADTQLRSKLQAMDEQLLTQKQEMELLRSENVELAKIATEMMDMAEKQHQEKQQILQLPDDEVHKVLVKTRTRLRESLG